VGCGAITESGHLPAALRSGLTDVAALVDTTVANAERLAARFGLTCPVTGSLASVIDQVEGVLVATPNHTHLPVAAIALERGIPTLIEKPLTTTSADADRICELAEQHGTFVAAGYRSRYWPMVPLLKHLLDTGYLGRVRSFSYTFGTRSTWAAVSNFALNRQMAGGGILIDAHVVDKVLFWFGDPTDFSFWDDSHGGVEGTCRAHLAFAHPAGAFEGEILLSRTMELDKRIVIQTDRYICELAEAPAGAIVLREPDRPEIRLDVQSDAFRAPKDRNDFQLQLEEFARNVRQRGTLTVDGRFASRSVRLIEAMYARRQQMPEPWMRRSTEMERARV
jgi:predicted dehydrogenase